MERRDFIKTTVAGAGLTVSSASVAASGARASDDATGHEVWRMTGGMDWTSPTAKDLLKEAK